MKTIGMIGGMSWESTTTYYQIINETVKEKLGGLHSAKILLYSVDFEEIERYQTLGEWERCGEILGIAAKNLEQAGADFIIICTNTMHKVLPQINTYIHIPVLHIAQATAAALKAHHITKAALLGTRYTMQQHFYKDILIENGIQLAEIKAEDMNIINHVIFEELCKGEIREVSRQQYIRIMKELKKQDIQAIILGCTEIQLLIQQEHIDIILFDTTRIHAQAAACYALQ